VSFLFFNVFLADFVVVILALLGLPAITTALARLVDVAIGAALALAAYLLWPTWEGTSAQEKFARLLDAQGRYVTALLRTYARPGTIAPAEQRAMQITARQARSDAEASADRLGEEPRQPPMTAELARDLTAAVRRFVNAALALHAAVTRREDKPDGAASADRPVHATGGPGPEATRPKLDEFAAGIDTATQQLAGALRALQPPGPLPALRELQTALSAEPTNAAVLTATDGLVDATNSVADILRGGLRSDHDEQRT
jgi:uncharacterized membrane protein YccC